jgi:hypothetical protein
MSPFASSLSNDLVAVEQALVLLALPTPTVFGRANDRTLAGG